MSIRSTIAFVAGAWVAGWTTFGISLVGRSYQGGVYTEHLPVGLFILTAFGVLIGFALGKTK